MTVANARQTATISTAFYGGRSCWTSRGTGAGRSWSKRLKVGTHMSNDRCSLNRSLVDEEVAEFDVVRLRTNLKRDGYVIAAGTLGVIVYIHNSGEAFEVEFERPTHDVVTVRAERLEKVHG